MDEQKISKMLEQLQMIADLLLHELMVRAKKTPVALFNDDVKVGDWLCTDPVEEVGFIQVVKLQDLSPEFTARALNSTHLVVFLKNAPWIWQKVGG